MSQDRILLYFSERIFYDGPTNKYVGRRRKTQHIFLELLFITVYSACEQVGIYYEIIAAKGRRRLFILVK